MLDAKAKRAIAKALKVLEDYAHYNVMQIHSASQMEQYARLRLTLEKREHFEVVFLNSQNFLIETVRMFSGTINQAPVFPREIVRKALELNAAAVVLMHNHPSGIAAL